MAFSYSYALSRGVDTQFRHINIAEADHFKQFLRQIKRAGLDIWTVKPCVLTRLRTSPILTSQRSVSVTSCQ